MFALKKKCYCFSCVLVLTIISKIEQLDYVNIYCALLLVDY